MSKPKPIAPNTTDQVTPWLELRVTMPVEALDPMSGFLWDLGVQGIVEEPRSRAGQAWVLLRAYIPSTESEALVAQTRAHLVHMNQWFEGAAQGRVSTRVVEEKDWNAEWKRHFKPIRLSTRFVVRPSWEPYEAQPGELVLDLDPGMAFGTGTHDTTRGCLKAIDALLGGGDLTLLGGGDLPLTPLAAGVQVLDVGTGSGILMIAALRAGAVRGVGIDIDPLSIQAATENCDRNGVGPRTTISAQTLQSLEGQFSLVLANILAHTLLELADDLIARLSPEGVLILSGMLRSQAAAVCEAYRERGTDLALQLDEGEWTTLVMRAPSLAADGGASSGAEG